jgi:type II secretory pathway pseudopilin PulG
VGVVALIVPVLALLLWSWRMAIRTDQAMAEEQRLAEARAALRARQDAYVRSEIADIQAQIAARTRFPSEEYPVTGDLAHVPEPNEAMAQLRAVMAGEIARCGVCHGTAPNLYKVDLAQNAMFACGPCAAIFNAGAHQ